MISPSSLTFIPPRGDAGRNCPEPFTDPPEPEPEDGEWYYGVWIPNGPEWEGEE
jgi:hypothetical protein